MFDLLLKNVSLPDGRTGMSIAVLAGKIVEVATALDAPAHQLIDAQGLVLIPPFVDAHFHMDAALSYGLPRVNQSGTLLEGIALWGELKPTLTQEALIGRASSPTHVTSHCARRNTSITITASISSLPFATGTNAFIDRLRFFSKPLEKSSTQDTG